MAVEKPLTATLIDEDKTAEVVVTQPRPRQGADKEPTMSQTRARKGGEVGRNGEFYPAGSFLCTTDLPKMARSVKKAAARKVQVGHYEWAEAPEGKSPLYVGAVGGVFADRFGNRRPLDGVTDEALAYLGLTREELAARVERHAAGERWL